MDKKIISLFPKRARGLSNTGLLDEFEAAWTARQRGDTPEIMARLRIRGGATFMDELKRQQGQENMCGG